MTFLRAAGQDSDPDLDGRDLADAAQGGAGHGELHWDCGWQWAVRDGRWKLSWVDADAETARYVREVEHTEPGAGLALWDLDGDVGETKNLAERHPDVVERLSRVHDAWRERVGLAEQPRG